MNAGSTTVWFTFGTERRADQEVETVHLRSGVPANKALHLTGRHDGFQDFSSLQPARQVNAVVRRCAYSVAQKTLWAMLTSKNSKTSS
jgi:hypothetical protein